MNKKCLYCGTRAEPDDLFCGSCKKPLYPSSASLLWLKVKNTFISNLKGFRFAGIITASFLLVLILLILTGNSLFFIKEVHGRITLFKGYPVDLKIPVNKALTELPYDLSNIMPEYKKSIAHGILIRIRKPKDAEFLLFEALLSMSPIIDRTDNTRVLSAVIHDIIDLSEFKDERKKDLFMDYGRRICSLITGFDASSGRGYYLEILLNLENGDLAEAEKTGWTGSTNARKDRRDMDYALSEALFRQGKFDIFRQRLLPIMTEYHDRDFLARLRKLEQSYRAALSITSMDLFGPGSHIYPVFRITDNMSGSFSLKVKLKDNVRWYKRTETITVGLCSGYPSDKFTAGQVVYSQTNSFATKGIINNGNIYRTVEFSSVDLDRFPNRMFIAVYDRNLRLIGSKRY